MAGTMDGSDGEGGAFAPHIETFAPAGGAPAEIVVAQTAQGAVVALDAASGALLWRWATHDPCASVARAGERIFVSTAISDRPIWVAQDPPPRLPEGAMPHASPYTLHARTRPTAVTALRASDGAVLWRETFYSHEAAPRTPVAITVAGDLLITTALSFEPGATELRALDMATGALRWSHRIGPLPTVGATWHPRLLWVEAGKLAVLTIVGEPVVSSEKAHYLILDAATGAELWQGEQAPPHDTASPQHETSGMRCALETSFSWPFHVLRAVRADSGVEVWRMTLDELSRGRSLDTNLLADDGRLYLFWRKNNSMRLRALYAGTGKDLWRWRSPVWLYWLFLARQAIQRGQQASRTGRWGPLLSDALRLRWLHPIRLEGDSALLAANGRLY
ncbi:MAG: PQQ-binding-like beta-propeller repeat protein, partial [Ktedonobacterales bacterium]